MHFVCLLFALLPSLAFSGACGLSDIGIYLYCMIARCAYCFVEYPACSFDDHAWAPDVDYMFFRNWWVFPRVFSILNSIHTQTSNWGYTIHINYICTYAHGELLLQHLSWILVLGNTLLLAYVNAISRYLFVWICVRCNRSYPNEDKLQPKLVKKPGCRAYTCQCTVRVLCSIELHFTSS